MVNQKNILNVILGERVRAVLYDSRFRERLAHDIALHYQTRDGFIGLLYMTSMCPFYCVGNRFRIVHDIDVSFPLCKKFISCGFCTRRCSALLCRSEFLVGLVQDIAVSSCTTVGPKGVFMVTVSGNISFSHW